MNKKRSMRVTTKLWVYFLAVLFFIAAISLIGFTRSVHLSNQQLMVEREAARMIELTVEWNFLTEANTSRDQVILTTSTPEILSEQKAAVVVASKRISDIRKSMDELGLTTQDKAQLELISDVRKRLFSARDAARNAKDSGDQSLALSIMKQDFLPIVKEYLKAQKDLIANQKLRLTEQQEISKNKSKENTTFVILSFLIVVALGVVAIARTVKLIKEPLAEAQTLSRRIAQGDLTGRVEYKQQDEFGELLECLASMNNSLVKMVSEVRLSTDSIATASAEIASGNNDLAHRTEQTSSDLQATASSMDQLMSTVETSTRSASQASELAVSASQTAQKGGVVVDQVVKTMKEIDESSRRIFDIISVVDGIAFQTNILALNAAVEAARAGEQGRGFAVVASEVRSLAGRSAGAAKEIKSLIGTSVEKTELGTRLVTVAGEAMNEIVQSVQRVADVIGDVTASASDQSQGISEINQAIGSLDRMTQQNAALVEESAAAAESLRDQADRLKNAVSEFRL